MELTPSNLSLSLQTSLIGDLKKPLLTTSAMVQIVMVSDYYDIYGCLLSQIEGCFFFSTGTTKLLKVPITSGKHGIRDTFQAK